MPCTIKFLKACLVVSTHAVSGGGSLKAPTPRFSGYTLAEIIAVMLIIAVIVAVTIGITKAKLDNIVSYTYYNAYSTLRKISTEMLADWDPQDPEYKQALITDKPVLAFNAPNDYRFFSMFLTRSPFGIQLPIEKARAGSTVTLYGCPNSGKYTSFGSESSFAPNYYSLKLKRCVGINLLYGDSLYTCPGKFNGEKTYYQ